MCGYAHSLAWSTNRLVNAGQLPVNIPMEYNHLQAIPTPVLWNRLVLIHHFTDLFCPSIPMFDMDQSREECELCGGLDGPDALRAVLVSSAKVRLGYSFSVATETIHWRYPVFLHY